MGYSLQTLSGFETFLQNQGFDSHTTGEIAAYLTGLGYTNYVAQDIEPGSAPTFNPGAQADIGVSSTITFAPTGLAAVLIDLGDPNIVVSATTPTVNVAVATESGVSNTVTLNDYGSDQVFLGSGGNNTVYSGYGNDTIDGGLSGNDDVYLRYGGNDSVNLTASTGSDSVGDSGSGKDTIDLGTGPSTVNASSQTGGSLDIQTSTGSATITLGSVGNDTVNVATNAGAGFAGVTDSITAIGTGNSNAPAYDTVTFDSSVASVSGPVVQSNPDGSVTYSFGFGGGYLGGPTPPAELVSVTADPGTTVSLQFTDHTFIEKA
jgi:hypothetical protein